MSKIYFGTNDDGDVRIVVDSVDIVMLSMDLDCVFVEGYIMSNIGFWAYKLLFFT